MPNKNFSDFAQRTTGLLNSDFIVGYDPAGPVEFRTTIGNLLSGGTASEKIQYTLWFGHRSSGAVADAATYYFGQLFDLDPVTAPQTSRSTFIAGTGRIKYASVSIYTGTLGSSELATLKVANVTDATESVISSSIAYTAQNQGTLYTLASPLAVSQSDQICMKWETPTWVTTNPSAIRHMITLYIV